MRLISWSDYKICTQPYPDACAWRRWRAWREEHDDEEYPTGYGATEEQAIRDLHDREIW